MHGFLSVQGVCQFVSVVRRDFIDKMQSAFPRPLAASQFAAPFGAINGVVASFTVERERERERIEHAFGV